MGQSGALYLFTQSTRLAPGAAMRSLLDLFPGTTMYICTQYDREDASWAHLQDEALHPDRESRIALPRIEHQWRTASLDEAADAARVGRMTSIQLVGSSRIQELATGIDRAIPESVSGRVVLAGPAVGVGGQDLWDMPVDSPDDQPVYYGRAQSYLCLFGHRIPPQTREYERRVVQVPEVVALQRDFEGVFGPAERCIIWDL